MSTGHSEAARHSLNRNGSSGGVAPRRQLSLHCPHEYNKVPVRPEAPTLLLHIHTSESPAQAHWCQPELGLESFVEVTRD